MRRVLVPLDRTQLAASILPDAKQLAGKEGELILICDPTGSDSAGRTFPGSAGEAAEEAVLYLESQAGRLRDQGMPVEAHAVIMIDPVFAIDTAIRTYRADMMACATHGRGPLGRLIRGGVVWRALADSSVPVLIRHVDAPIDYQSIFAPEPRILVPLDGSKRAEQALLLAQELAAEWDASIWLVHVVSSRPITGFARTDIDPKAITDDEAKRAVRGYLGQVAASLSSKVHKHVLFGPVTEHLVASVRAWNISHVVMTSHGRTGLPRVLLGSVADDLIQRLACPIIVIPMHAHYAVENSGVDRENEVLEPT